MLVLAVAVAVVLMVMREEQMMHKVRQVVHILAVQVYILVFNHPQVEQ